LILQIYVAAVKMELFRVKRAVFSPNVSEIYVPLRRAEMRSK
jgi:hypothetical protein